MAMGYEGYAQITPLNSSPLVLLCTGANVTSTDKWIKSSGAYYGSLSLSGTGVNTQPLDSPMDFDYPEIGGNISFEANIDTVNLIINMINKRNLPFAILLATKLDGTQVFSECYWTEVSLAGSTGGVLTGSISLSAKGTINGANTYTYGTNMSPSGSGGANAFNVNPPIPYWNTTGAINGSNLNGNLMDWSISFSQTVNRFFTCPGGGLSNPNPPITMNVGPCTGSFSGNLAVIDPLKKEIDSATIRVGSHTNSGGYVQTNGHTFDMQLFRETFEEPIVSASTISVIPLKYFIRHIEAS